MIRGSFLDQTIRADLITLVRNGKAETRLTRRANALLLLDDGMSCEEIAKVLYLDDDTIRYWHELYSEKGLSWLADFGYKGRACELTAAQQDALKSWVAQSLPQTTTMVGEWIEKSYGVSYSRSALIKLLRRNDMEYRKPELVPPKLDPVKQQAFIDGYEKLLNTRGDDEAVEFADAVHPTHAVRPAGCWAPKDTKIAIAGTSGRQRLNLHGAVDLETGAAYDRSDNGRCRQHNRAVDGNRDDVPHEKTHSRLSRQCPVPPCCPGSGVAPVSRSTVRGAEAMLATGAISRMKLKLAMHQSP